ncbi:hypothetical protein BDN70DRAFT_933202 [Pholiota conissans]|uniref:Uncharacterized protein n=1 Tax=Pholiota conissans TaxID=109636 RepID=A0A9P6CZV1_9AGAR|nr:hypothetical protein BDN70DRAFT_933202 [Pholiota conissans]
MDHVDPQLSASTAISFPSSNLLRSPDLSVMSTRATARDVCYTVYGESPVGPETVANFYESSATTSRSVIGDIHRLSRQMSTIDVPRPLAMLCTLFRLRPPRTEDSLFHALRIWTDVIDICENESFDGHRKAIVEHTLNILLLPGIHCEGTISHRAQASTESLVNVHGFPMPHIHPFTSPSLPIPGTSLSFPSPLHSKLRIITRLSFNEQGLVTHHRDIWDIKDVVGLVPGVSLAQWIGTRVAAVGLSYISRHLLPRGKHEACPESTSAHPVDLETGR